MPGEIPCHEEAPDVPPRGVGENMRNADPQKQWQEQLRRVERRRLSDCAAETKPLWLVQKEISRVNVRGRREHKTCAMIHETGEIQCRHQHSAPPREDCRVRWCPHFPIMHQRRIAHAQSELARKRNRRGGQ
ncbi:hypothetical protein [Microviridae sp.]|nr:hypothetical protein [Microviridae sp.]